MLEALLIAGLVAAVLAGLVVEGLQPVALIRGCFPLEDRGVVAALGRPPPRGNPGSSRLADRFHPAYFFAVAPSRVSSRPIDYEGRLTLLVQHRRLEAEQAQQLAQIARDVGEALPRNGALPKGGGHSVAELLVADMEGFADTWPGWRPEEALLMKEERGELAGWLARVYDGRVSKNGRKPTGAPDTVCNEIEHVGESASRPSRHHSPSRFAG